LFAPTPELLKWWKASAQDAEAKLEYKRQFLLILQSRQQLIVALGEQAERQPCGYYAVLLQESWGFLPSLPDRTRNSANVSTRILGW
jgi:hypothetical protein